MCFFWCRLFSFFCVWKNVSSVYGPGQMSDCTYCRNKVFLRCAIYCEYLGCILLHTSDHSVHSCMVFHHYELEYASSNPSQNCKSIHNIHNCETFVHCELPNAFLIHLLLNRNICTWDICEAFGHYANSCVSSDHWHLCMPGHIDYT